jgi:hypothetical protein
VNTGPQDQDPQIATLGEDLMLLTVQQCRGGLPPQHVLGIGLMGAELVRLATDGRIDIASARIQVLDAAPTGDAEADAALASLTVRKRPPRAKAWCYVPRPGICDAYLARLVAAGAITAQEQTRLRFIRVRRWQVTDPARAQAARARLDAIARSTGEVDPAQAAFGGLAHAIGLAGGLYPGKDGRAARKRLEAVAEGDLTAAPAGHAAHHAVHAASHAAVSAAVHSATHAAAAAAHSAGGGHDGGGGGHH